MCVILLTSHFMDEADILADRKAIIHEGKTLPIHYNICVISGKGSTNFKF